MSALREEFQLLLLPERTQEQSLQRKTTKALLEEYHVNPFLGKNEKTVENWTTLGMSKLFTQDKNLIQVYERHNQDRFAKLESHRMILIGSREFCTYKHS